MNRKHNRAGLLNSIKTIAGSWKLLAAVAFLSTKARTCAQPSRNRRRTFVSGRQSIILWFRARRRLLLLLASLIGAGAIAQVTTTPTVAPVFIAYDHGFGVIGRYDTLDQAETAIRNNTAYYGAQDKLEHVSTSQLGSNRLWLKYKVVDRTAERLYAPMYYLASAIAGYGKPGCSQAPADPNYSDKDYCGSEAELIAYTERKLAERWPGCTLTTTVLTHYQKPTVTTNGTSNVVRYTSGKDLNTRAECTQTGTWYQHGWEIAKIVPFYCPTGYESNIAWTVEGENFGAMNLCRARQRNNSTIETSIQQCASCAGSPNPIYPATGEKQRHEEDFTFAGRTFTRHYRSIRQFRNNTKFAVSWNHSWSDRIISGPSSTVAYAHIDEYGNYESYTLLSGNRYRGENSTGRVLERINANGIGWRLRLPGGEAMDFDLDGKLIAVRDPAAPLNDLVIVHADDVVQAVSDVQGRLLRFEYSGNLLSRIVLPDATDVSYIYDANRNLVGVTYTGSSTRQYHYNEAGLAGAANQRHHLTGITAEDGQRLASFRYDTRGRVTESRMLGSPNEVTTASYPTEDTATLGTAAGGTRSYTLEPGIYRRVLTSSDGTDSTHHAYESDGRLIRSTNKRGIVTEYGYSGAYRTSVTLAVGTDEQRREEFDHDPVTGRLTEQRTKDRTGTLVARSQWTYNSRGQATASRVFDPSTGASREALIQYCEASDVSAGTCPMVGLTIAVDGPRAGTSDVTRYFYRMADDAGCATSATACAYRKGDLWKTTNALGQTAEILRHDGMGRVQSLRDINGVQTDIEYDRHGRVLSRKVRGTDDAGEYDDQITRIRYNAVGSVQEVRLPDGTVTRYEYDAAQRLTGIVDSDGNRMRFVLNAVGERIREDVQDASGSLLRTLSRTYDVLGNLNQQLDAQNRASTFLYDPEGNLTLETDRLGRKTRHEYDALGRLRNTLQDVDGVAASTQFQYDAQDRVTQVLDPNGLPTRYQYNGFGDLVRQESPDTGVATTTYDEAGNLKTRTDARGITATYGYDVLDRLTSVAYPDSSRNIGFVYDTAPTECPISERFHLGRLARMNDVSGSTLYCYDRFGYTTRSLQSTQGRSFVLAYQRAPRSGWTGSDYLLRPRPADGHLYGLTYPDGARIQISRNGQRQPSGITVTLANGQAQTLLSGAVYYPFGPVSQWTYGNGRVMRRSRNQNYQPGFVETSGPGGLSLGYWFDAAGNLESLRKADQADPTRRKYRYDGLNRLTEVRDGATNTVLQAYTYDRTGNRTSKANGAATQGYSYTAGTHRLASIGGEQRQYDAMGNTTRVGGTASASAVTQATPMQIVSRVPSIGARPMGRPAQAQRASSQRGRGGQRISAPLQAHLSKSSAAVREYVYDDTGRMRQVRHDGVAAMDYLYNGKGERVYRSGGGQSVTTLYDDGGKWIGDYDGNGQPIQQVIWMDDLPVGLLMGAGANQKLYYIEADALGTPRVVVDPARNVAVWTWSLEGEAFGDSAPNQDADGDGAAFVFDMRFPGQRYDAASGLNYNYFRDYEAGTGRYVQSDPIGLEGGVSTYAYVESEPLTSVDPEGEQRRTIRPTTGFNNPYRQPLQELGRGGAGRVPLNVRFHRIQFVPDTPTSCSACMEILITLPVRGVTRGSHRYYANRNLYEELANHPQFNQQLSQALGVSNVYAMMRATGRRDLVNPPGTNWHHQPGYPSQVWLVRRCDHRRPDLQSFLHPNGIGGYGRHYSRTSP